MADTSSSTSGSIHYKHDVYLCFRGFRGEDSRYSFITNLYVALRQAGVNTFMDGVEVETVITGSRASIIILSEKFGTSRQCLDQLLLILEHRRQNNHFVLPVFYKVDPSDVRNLRGSFMMEGDEGVKGSKRNQWKAALREVGSLSGMVLSGSETAFIADIVSAIIRALDSKRSSFVSEFEHLRIHLGELKKATNSFRSKVLGTGGFGKVYEGEISHSHGRSLVAIKRLNREFGQGDPEFWKEIMMLSRYTHRNLISLLGFCDEDGEKILVYEHASNGSLDRHLSSTVLTWTQRLQICLDAARGLAYLHDDKGSRQRVLHRDIKSANILLDENWNAKLSDMGLSKIGPANQRHTVLITNIVGTPGYCDPQYMETYSLTKESDIYSFGVVLFEVLCGRLCFDYTNGQLKILVPTWKQSYIHKKLDHIIFKDLASPMDPTSLETFSNIAFQCLHYNREQRPEISILVERIETALEFQKLHDTETR